LWSGEDWKRIDQPYPTVWISEPASAEMDAAAKSGGQTTGANLVGCRPRRDAAEQARVIARTNCHATIEVKADRSGILVWQESFHPGWTAQLNGSPVELIAACGDFIGCRIAAGQQTIRFEFAPRDFRMGKLATATGGTILALLLVTVATAWTRRLFAEGRWRRT
jgi:hypothetical protein